MHSAAAKLKRFVVDRIVEPVLPLRMLEAYVVFWARIVRAVRRPFIIGVTGSVGKSTTTAMIAAALSHPHAVSRVGRVAQTRDNMNDDIGVAATLLRFERFFALPWPYPHRLGLLFAIPLRALRVAVSRYPNVIVMEFGIGATSHFRRLVRIAPPALGVVTRIGAAHLELFKSIHGVVQEKGELVRAVPGSGLIVLASDHDHVAALEAMARAPVVKVPGGGVELSRQIARIVCRHLGVPDDVVDESLRSFRNPKGRLNVLRFSGLTLIDDSYNANPLSMALGLDTLADIGADGRRRVAVLGYMAELGDESGRYHEEVATHARRCSDLLIGVGAAAKLYQPDLWYATSAECAEAIDRLLRFDDCVLVKGSFAAQMELVSDRIKAIGGSSQSLSRCAA